jgi:hypothetical protein
MVGRVIRPVSAESRDLPEETRREEMNSKAFQAQSQDRRKRQLRASQWREGNHPARGKQRETKAVVVVRSSACRVERRDDQGGKRLETEGTAKDAVGSDSMAN